MSKYLGSLHALSTKKVAVTNKSQTTCQVQVLRLSYFVNKSVELINL